MTEHTNLQERLDAALIALNRMTGQRDQLAAQFKDATAQLARAGDLLRRAREELMGDTDRDLFTPGCVTSIDSYLAGKPEGQ